jgi:hypothetical protein
MTAESGQRDKGKPSPSRAPASAAYEPETTLLTWSSSLVRRNPKTFAAGILATAVGLGAVWWSFGGEIGPVILAAMLLGGALGPLYLPTTYTFTDKKAYQRIFFSRDGYRWQDFDECRTFGDGVYLHLRPTDLRMRYLKGLTVYFSSTNRQAVLDLVRERIQPADAVKEAGRAGSGQKN